MALPVGIIVIVDLGWIISACDDNTEHDKWLTKGKQVMQKLHMVSDRNVTQRVNKLEAEQNSLSKKKSSSLSFRGKLISWALVFFAIFLVVTGFVTSHYCDKIRTAYLAGNSKYVTKVTPKIKDYVLLKEDNDTISNGVKQQVTKVNQADEIVLKLDNGQTVKMPGPNRGNNLHKVVVYKQSVINHEKHQKNIPLDMKLTISKPKAKYHNYRDFTTNYRLVVTQEFGK